MTRRRTTYGQKGGQGPTAGRKAVTYRATLPDGSVATKRSFHVDSAEAHLGCYQHDGKWYVSAVVASPQPWPRQQFVPARRVT
jgi:hypothetical protein